MFGEVFSGKILEEILLFVNPSTKKPFVDGFNYLKNRAGSLPAKWVNPVGTL
jgi:hypothetical protein